MTTLNITPSPETLSALAEALRRHDYTEARAAAALDLPHLGHFFEQAHSLYRYSVLRADPALADLVRLFLINDPIPTGEAVALLGQDLTVGLVRGAMLAVADEGYVRSRYIVSPIDGAWIITDRRVAGGKNRIMPLGHDTYNLVTQTQHRPGGTVLDIGTGSGVQGVLAARWASRVLSVDINPRALDFARMNAHLNGVYERMEFKLGSLYDPAEGERFDVLLANPPFVPHPEYDVLFRDGGVQGEDILHVIIRDAPAHLKPGGLLQIMTEIIYHDEAHAGDKARAWAADGLRGVIFEQDDDFLDIYAQEHVYRAFDAEDTNTTLAQQTAEYQKFLDSVGIHKITHATLHLELDTPAEGVAADQRRPVAVTDVADLRSVSREQVAAALRAVAATKEPGWLSDALDTRATFDPALRVVASWSPADGAALATRVEFEAGCPWRSAEIEPLGAELLRRLATTETVGQWLEAAAELMGRPVPEAMGGLESYLGELVRCRWVDLLPAA